MKTRKRNKKSGFSLLELLAVVTILGIIAAVIVPRVTASSAAAELSVQQHHLAVINGAIEQMLFDGGTPAGDLTNLTGGTPNYLPGGIPDNPVEVAKVYRLTTDGTQRCEVTP